MWVLFDIFRGCLGAVGQIVLLLTFFPSFFFAAKENSGSDLKISKNFDVPLQERNFSIFCWKWGSRSVQFSFWRRKSERIDGAEQEETVRGLVLLDKRLAVAVTWKKGSVEDGPVKQITELVVHPVALRPAVKSWAKNFGFGEGLNECESEKLALLLIGAFCVVRDDTKSVLFCLGDVILDRAFDAVYTKKRMESRVEYKSRERSFAKARQQDENQRN